MIRLNDKEAFSPIEYSYEVEAVLLRKESAFQEILVVKNPHFGRMMVLDGVVQLTSRDEFFYHEMLTHVVMQAHPAPRTVAVIGGGDGATVREVLKHSGVEKVFLVEIDEEIIKASKLFFPETALSLNDSRVEIKLMDGAEFVKAPECDIDVFIVDAGDIVGFAKSLFTEEFFLSLADCLTEEGMFVTHTGSMHFHRDTVVDVQNTLKKVLPVVDLYTTSLATYPGNWWTFAAASKKYDLRDSRRSFQIKTRYYDNEIHKQCFLTEKLYTRLMRRELDW